MKVFAMLLTAATISGNSQPVQQHHKLHWFGPHPAQHVSAYGCGNDKQQGNPLAGGGVLTPSTLGVAHRTFPFGRKIRLRANHHDVIVPVVDRGPYVYSRVFDLTIATANRLGIGCSTGTVRWRIYRPGVG